MVCPVAKKQARQDSPTDYPYEPLYRPWSWILSSFSNILLFAVLFAVLYIMYRKRKSKGKKQVTYRTVETTKSQVLESQGKINALVTGGSGVLGGEIVRSLVADGQYRVYSLDLTIPELDNRNEDVYSYIQGDITDIDSLRLALKDIEVVFHTAAIVPMFVGFTDQDFYDINATGTENVVAACKENGVKRLILTSSTNVMLSSDPNQVPENLDESVPYPKQPKYAYGGAKAIAERCVLSANKDGLLTCALRLTWLFSYENSIKNAEHRYCGDGSAKQQIIPVDTAARVHLLAEKRLQAEGGASVIAGKAYNVSFEDTFSFREFHELLASETGAEEGPGSVPMWLVKLIAYFNLIVYRVTGSAPVNSQLRVDTLFFLSKSHTCTAALGRKDIGWEDKRTWKDVVRQMIKENSETKKDK